MEAPTPRLERPSQALSLEDAAILVEELVDELPVTSEGVVKLRVNDSTGMAVA